jgi:hypothetical protein
MKNVLQKTEDGQYFIVVNGRKIIVDIDQLVGNELNFTFLVEGVNPPIAIINI